MRRAVLSGRVLLALGMAVVALMACSTGPQAPAQRVTASDQTESDRRARVRLELASLYFGRGQNETALDEVKLALLADPNSFEGYNLRGLIYAALGDEALALDSFQRALQINPRDGDSLHNLGWFHCQRGHHEPGAAMFRQALALPQYLSRGRTLLAQGVCEARAGQWLAAEGSLMKAYELDPGNPVTAVNLSQVLLERGELQRARFYIARVNAAQELASAQTLWLAARIEKRIGNEPALRDLGTQLRTRFPQSPEALRFERSQYDD